MILPAHKNALLNGEGESGCWQKKFPLPSFYSVFFSFFGTWWQSHMAAKLTPPHYGLHPPLAGAFPIPVLQQS